MLQFTCIFKYKKKNIILNRTNYHRTNKLLHFRWNCENV